MAAPTRFPSGVSTQPVGTQMGMYPMPDPTELAQDFEDFFQYVAGNWTVTNTTTHQTIGLVAGANGLVSTVGGGSSVTNDIGAIQANPLNFNIPVNSVSSSLPPTNQSWFYAAFKATNINNDLLIIGNCSSIATMAPSDGIYFSKAAGASTLQFVVRKSSSSLAATAYSTGTTTVATLASNTWVEVGWYYDGKGNIDVFINEAKVCSVDVGVGSGTVASTFPQAVNLGMGFGCKAAATAPTTADMIVDFMLSSQVRTL